MNPERRTTYTSFWDVCCHMFLLVAWGQDVDDGPPEPPRRKAKRRTPIPIKRQVNLASNPPHFNQYVLQLLPYTCLTLRPDRCGSRRVALSPWACMRHFETMSKTLHPRICLWRERRFGRHAATNAALRWDRNFRLANRVQHGYNLHVSPFLNALDCSSNRHIRY